MSERCPWAIKFGTTLHTRCMLPASHGDAPTEVAVRLPENSSRHIGRGLEEFSYQRIEWIPGDRREYQTERADEYAWEES